MSPSTSVQLMTDAVIAQYIHEISVRHRPRRAHFAGDGGAPLASSRRPTTRARAAERRQIRGIPDYRLCTAVAR